MPVTNRQPTWRSSPWLTTIGIGLCSLLLAIGSDEARHWAQYQRQAIEGGEFWRLISGHLAHLGWGHLWMNLLALALLTMIFRGTYTAWSFLVVAVAGALAIDLGLYFLSPSVIWYVGLSGVLHGLFSGAVVSSISEQPRLGLALMIPMLAKLLYEQSLGPLPMTQAASGGDVVVAAHLYGAFGGALGAGALLIGRKLRLSA